MNRKQQAAERQRTADGQGKTGGPKQNPKPKQAAQCTSYPPFCLHLSPSPKPTGVWSPF